MVGKDSHTFRLGTQRRRGMKKVPRQICKGTARFRPLYGKSLSEVSLERTSQGESIGSKAGVGSINS